MPFSKWADAWASFPPPHKKRVYQSIAAYGLLVALTGGYVFAKAGEARKDWSERMPHAEAPVKTVYLTPQISEAEPTTFDFGGQENAEQNAVAAPGPARGYVAIIVSDAGLESAITKRALDDLPPEIAVAFSPYSQNLKDWISDAKSEDHEALVLLPMEPGTYPKDDPGPKALLTRLSDRENANNLAEILSAAEGAVGVMNFMGSRFMMSEQKLTPIFAVLQKNGALFVETPSVVKTKAGDVALREKLPYIAVDIQIDEKATDADVKQQLLSLEKIALEKGHAIGIAHPYPVTFNLIKRWAEELESRSVKLVPLSALWKIKQGEGQPQKQEDQKEEEKENHNEQEHHAQ